MASQVILKKSSVAARVPVAGDLVFGELALNYADGLLYYKKSDGTTIGSLGSGSTSTYTRTSFTATAAQTVFTVTYTVGYIQVYYKGILQPSAEYTATNGTSITLTTAAALNDLIEVIAYTTSTIGTIGPTTVTGIISGGGNQINNVIIGASTPLAGSFTALTTSSTVTLSGGTANGVAYLNGSNVLTSGSALTFDGTNLNVGIGGVGKVQIGTASSGTFQTGLYASNGVDTDFQVRFKTGVSEFGTSTATPLAFSINGSEQMRLTSTGLGIGTSSPAYKLDIASTTTNPTARVRSNGGAIGNYAELLLQSFNSYSGSGQAYVRGVSTAAGNSNTALIFGVNNSGFGAPYEAMCLDSSGNLGLGVTPSAWGGGYKAFQIQGAALWSGLNFVNFDQNSYFNGTSDVYISTPNFPASRYTQANGIHYWNTAPSGTAGAAIAFTQAMTLDASGNLSVGSGPARGNISVSSGIAGSVVTTALHLGYSLADFYGSRIVNTNDPAETAAGLFKIQQGTTAAWRDDLIIDNNGNLGVGVTPSAWFSTWKALQILGTSYAADSNSSYFLNNAVVDPSGTFRYIASKYAVQYHQDSSGGTHTWNTAPSGTAGAAIAFTKAMTLDASGNLSVGPGPARGNISVSSGIAGSVVTTSLHLGYSLADFYGSRIVNTNDPREIPAGLFKIQQGTTAAWRDDLIIDNKGNLGLGVTPSAWYYLYGAMQLGISSSLSGSTIGSAVWLSSNAHKNSSNVDTYITTATASSYEQLLGVHSWKTAPSGTAGAAIAFTRAMTLDASANLSVGTTSIASPGQTNGLTAGGPIAAKGALTAHTTSVGVVEFQPATNAMSIRAYGATAGTGYIVFKTGGGGGSGDFERARIDSNGRIQINTTAPKYNATLTIVKGGNSYNITSSVTATGSQGHMVFENNNADAVGTVFTNGSSTAYNTSSDYRLKEAIAPMTGALAKVALLKPCTYKWKVDGSDGQGFIAHELQEVVEGCVTGTKDATETVEIKDEQGNVTGTEQRPVYQGIDTSFLVATLTAAIQEQQALITSLTTRLTALENK